MKGLGSAALAVSLAFAVSPVSARGGHGYARSAPGRANFASYNNRGAAFSQYSLRSASGFVARTTAQTRGAGSSSAPHLAAGGYRGLAGFHPMGSSYFGSAMTRGTQYAAPTGGGGAPGGKGGSTGNTGNTAPAPVQGFAVPGALIRTAGLETHYSQPSQGERTFEVAAGTPQLNPALADSSVNYAQGPHPGEVTKNPTPNPGWGYNGMNPSGNNAITPNGALYAPGTGPVLGN